MIFAGIAERESPQKMTRITANFLRNKEMEMKTRKAHLSIPDRRMVEIARKTLRLSDVGSVLMGGMTKQYARETLFGFGWSENRIAKAEGARVKRRI